MKNVICLLLSIYFFTQINAQMYEINASSLSSKKIIQLPFSGTNPSGDKLSVNNIYFEKNGQPWFPIMGEFHYNRVRPEEWKQELLKMKAGGLSVVATYIFWNEHEIEKGLWDWKGNRDLRKFIETAKECGLYVWLRIGPWSHGEQLHGGHPEWIDKMKEKRSNSPAYIEASAKLFQQIGKQSSGLYFKDGGPIIGVQLENEYASGQAEHISKLKELALAAKIEPVYWSVTANTVFDASKMEVIPLQGSYPYRGWERNGGKATKDFLYGNDQWIMTDALGKLYYDINTFPKGLCEQGAGSQMTYENRFIVEPHVIEAHLQNQVGRGMNLIGYYMFKGGTQTSGLKEPGCPESYDFQAPIGEFGYLRSSYKYLKILHNFINDFGNELAPMQVVEPANPVRDELETERLRYIARVNGNRGFLFLGNTQVRVSMPDKKIQLRVKLKDEVIEFPSFVLKGQTTPILPFNMPIKNVLVKYATAQPFAKIENNGNVQVFFQKLVDVNSQVSLTLPSGSKVDAKGWVQNIQSGNYVLSAASSNTINIKQTDGKIISLIFLDRAEVEKSWRINYEGKQLLVVSDADVLRNDKSLELLQLKNKDFRLKIYPANVSFIKISKPVKGMDYTEYISSVNQKSPQMIFVNDKGQVSIKVPYSMPSNISDLFIDITYLGGSAEVLLNGKTATDNLYNGTSWRLGLKRFLGKEILIKANPWKDNITGVAEDKVKLIKQKGPSIEKIEILPQYKNIIDL